MNAARWLATVDGAARHDTREVVVPKNGNTDRLFGVAHRIFLCATYTVRTDPEVASVSVAPGRVVLAGEGTLMPSAAQGWRTIRRDCSGR